MSLSPIEYLQHVLDETAYLIDKTRGLCQKQFMNDETLKRAFVRSLEIIGEAVKKLPNELRQKYTQRMESDWGNAGSPDTWLFWGRL